MSSASNYLKTALVNGVLRGITYTAPTTVYLCLYSDTQTDADAGTELSGNGYARIAIAFDADTLGVTQNTSEHVFTASGGAWPQAQTWGIRDAASGGNLLIHGALTTPQTLGDGDTLTLAAGELDVTVA